MSRVFKIEEWAPMESISRSSTSSRMPTDGIDSAHDSSVNLSAQVFRKRLNSLPVLSKMDNAQETTLEQNQPREEGKRKGTFRTLLRRASISIKNRQRRHSHAVEELRPQTAWHKLKTATSFSRHSKFPPAYEDRDTIDEFREEYLAPTPGIGSEPPFIPRGSGGAAARATAAAQNEWFGRNQNLFFREDPFEDRESGIGIAVSARDDFIVAPEDAVPTISRVDFIADLPTEIAIQIFSHLNEKSLRQAALASPRWAEIAASQHVWREVFLREQTKTYATSSPLALGAGLGLPAYRPDHDWKDLYRIRNQLERNWVQGTAESVYLNGHLDSIYCVQFDEKKIITGSRDKTVRIWDMKTYSCKLIIGPPEVVENPAIMIGSDGRPAHYATMPDLSRVGESTPDTVSFPIYHTQSILCLQYDDEILVTGSSDGTCIVYDIKNGYTPKFRLVKHAAAVLDLAFDKNFIVTCSKDISICVWDRNTGALIKQLRGHTGPVNAVQLRGNTVVSCSGDFKVKLWNIDTGKNIKELVGHTKGLACSQFSDDSRFIASAGNDKMIRIWDANTGECLKVIEAHENLVRSLHIDSVSGRLVSGSYDTDIKVFSMATGELLLDFPKWHSSWVLGAKSDYRRIVSTGQDPKILIMDFGSSIRGIEKLES